MLRAHLLVSFRLHPARSEATAAPPRRFGQRAFSRKAGDQGAVLQPLAGCAAGLEESRVELARTICSGSAARASRWRTSSITRLAGEPNPARANDSEGHCGVAGQ